MSDVYVRLSEGEQASTKAVTYPGGEVMVDLDAHGEPIGLEVLDAVAVEVDGRSMTGGADSHELCRGTGTVREDGYYVPGEQFVEPPYEARCEACLGTGSAEVAATLHQRTQERDYLLGRLAEQELLLRYHDTPTVTPEQWAEAIKWPVIRERLQMSRPDDDDPYRMGLPNSYYRAIGRKEFE